MAVMMMNNQPCTECGYEDPVYLHHFPGRDHGTSAKLCSSCVLKNNLTKFCIICFDLLDEEETATSNQVHVPDTNSRVTCRGCPAIVHLACLLPSTSSSSSSGSAYSCPQCTDPSNFKFFDVKKTTDDEGGSGRGRMISWPLSEDLFKQLFCAGKIALAALAPLAYEEEMKRARTVAMSCSSLEEAMKMRDDLLAQLTGGINLDGGGDGEQEQQAPGDAMDLDAGDNAGHYEQEQQARNAEDLDATVDCDAGVAKGMDDDDKAVDLDAEVLNDADDNGASQEQQGRDAKDLDAAVDCDAGVTKVMNDDDKDVNLDAEVLNDAYENGATDS